MAAASDDLVFVKQEAPAARATAEACASSWSVGSPLIVTPVASGPPRTELPAATAQLPKAKKGSLQESMQRMAAAAKARREAPPDSAGASSSAPLDDVECTGERSRAERDAELRRDAVDVDGSD